MSSNQSNDQQTLACSYAALCAGCEYLNVPLNEQRKLKTAALSAELGRVLPGHLFPQIDWVSVDKGALRDRVDLMIDRRAGGYRVGLFDRFRTGLVDLQGCPQLSPALESWLHEFREIEIPIERGSVRLRVSPSGLKGIWLDFANVDIKSLLEERSTLERLKKIAVVEIGQKRKRLVEIDGKLKLADPVLEPWFETYVEGRRVPLYCAIGSFTQPGFRANRALIDSVTKRLPKTKALKVAEFGSGIGNFTVPLATIASRLDAFEVDELALEGLRRTLKENDLESKVSIHAGNFQGARAEKLEFFDTDLLFVDPPRSGLMKFLDPIEALEPTMRPGAVIYVSCFAESFATDTKRLIDLGYRISDLSIVDQFPQSRHFEIVSLFEKISG